ncbi:MAG: hypothetical protein GY953_48700 [bacterium]|nr:hypothetical protein [bacterium]
MKHRDPISWAGKISAKVLLVIGSNDFACPPAVTPKFASAFPSASHLVMVPNGMHSPGTRRHGGALRMWVDHVMFGRPLIEVKVKRLDYDPKTIRCSASKSPR